MCGIVGYVGLKNARNMLLGGLKRLEYRGYDSAGMAFLLDGVPEDLSIVKKRGGIEEGLEVSLAEAPFVDASSGIGHTRWATHGAPSDVNAHPHTDCTGRLAVVHNGIIENYRQLRRELTDKGHTFISDTDTEVIPHLIEEYRCNGQDLVAAVNSAVEQLDGSYAIAVLDGSTPGRMIGVRKDSPMIVGLTDDGNFLASDVPAVLPYTREVIILENHDVAVIEKDAVYLYRDGERIEPDIHHVDWDPGMAEREGYPHFMLKEIEEQPAALRAALSGRVQDGRVSLSDVDLPEDVLTRLNQIYLVGCGTSYHAGVAAAPLFETMVGVPVRPMIGSEFRYGPQLMDDRSLVILISQSGETADTLACLDLATRRGCPTVSVVNVVGSSMARGSDNVLYTRAGPEISVASTKTYTAHLLVLLLLAIELGQRLGRDDESVRPLLADMAKLPDKMQDILADVGSICRVAEYVAGREDVFFIGRGLDHAAVMEGQLKLKEISYIHAEAYPAGELKHGTLALIEEGVPVIAVSTQDDLRGKMASNVEEVRARGAWVALITDRPNDEAAGYADAVIPVPGMTSEVAPFFVAVLLQLLAYHAAVLRDCPVDRPRNLAKSVTVE